MKSSQLPSKIMIRRFYNNFSKDHNGCRAFKVTSIDVDSKSIHLHCVSEVPTIFTPFYMCINSISVGPNTVTFTATIAQEHFAHIHKNVMHSINGNVEA